MYVNQPSSDSDNGWRLPKIMWSQHHNYDFLPARRRALVRLIAHLLLFKHREALAQIFIYVAVSGNLHSQLVVAVSGRTC